MTNKKTNCDEFALKIMALVDGELSDTEKRQSSRAYCNLQPVFGRVCLT